MTLTQTLTEYIRACFTGLWIESREHVDALQEIAALCRDQNWHLASWNLEQGLSVAGRSLAETPTNDPLAAIRSLSALAQSEGTTLLVLENFHRFLNSAEIVQALIQQMARTPDGCLNHAKTGNTGGLIGIRAIDHQGAAHGM